MLVGFSGCCTGREGVLGIESGTGVVVGTEQEIETNIKKMSHGRMKFRRDESLNFWALNKWGFPFYRGRVENPRVESCRLSQVQA
jgi:hypothetical protein